MMKSAQLLKSKRLATRSLLLLWVSTSAFGMNTSASRPFDGNWSVVLTCPDTTDRNGLVKGYEYLFTMSVADGVIRAEYGAPGHPASVVYGGQVSDDGQLEITAKGNTGRSEFSVGKVAQGTQYNYTMRGKLERSAGQATRQEVRPCTAKFTRL